MLPIPLSREFFMNYLASKIAKTLASAGACAAKP